MAEHISTQPTTTTVATAISTKYSTCGYPITNTSVRDYYNTRKLPYQSGTTTTPQSSTTTTSTPVQQQVQIAPQINYVPPLMPAAVNTFQQTDLPGKPVDIIISTHVPQSVKNKVWAYSYIDLGALINSYNPDEQEQFDLLPDRQTNNITLWASNKHINITSFALWNKAFRIVIELTACRWPQLCLPMIQYPHFINEQSGKFPFQQVYAYDEKFHHQLVTNPPIPWNQVDNQLWSRELHGRLSKRSLQTPIFMSALITTKASAPGLAANSHTSVTNVTDKAIQQYNAKADQGPAVHQLLQDQPIKTPVNPIHLEQHLQGHPSRQLVTHVVNGFTFGFSLKYNGPRTGCVHPNLKSANQFPQLLLNRIDKKCELGRILGPFQLPPLRDLICSPVGMVLKKNSEEMRMIMHLS